MKTLPIIISAVVAASAGGVYYLINEDFEDQAFPPTWVQYNNGGNGTAEWLFLPGGPTGYYAGERAVADPGEYITAGVETDKFHVPFMPVLNFSFNYAAAYRSPGLATARLVIESSSKPTQIVPLPFGDWKTKAGTIHNLWGYPVYRFRWELRCISTSPADAYLLVDNLVVWGTSYATVAPASLGRVKAIYR